MGERGFKNGNMIQHGVYHKNTRIFYRGKIVSSSYVQDCLNVGFLHAYQLFESYGYKGRYVSVAMEEKFLNICYTANTLGNRNFNHITNHSRRCKIYIYTVSKGKLIKEDIYTRLDESKLFIGLLVNLISTLFPIIIERFV